MTTPTSTHDPRSTREAWATPVVVGGALTFAALTALVAAGKWSTLPTFLALVAFCACWLGARVVIRDIAEGRRDRVDEYEMTQRNDARNVGYAVTLGLGWVVFIVLSVAANLAENGHEQLLMSAPALLFTALVGGSATPSFLLAWRLRRRLDA